MNINLSKWGYLYTLNYFTLKHILSVNSKKNIIIFCINIYIKKVKYSFILYFFVFYMTFASANVISNPVMRVVVSNCIGVADWSAPIACNVCSLFAKR